MLSLGLLLGLKDILTLLERKSSISKATEPLAYNATMNNTLKFELNIALIPEQNLAEKHIGISRQLARKYPALVQLNDVHARLALAPHLTLYQVPIDYKEFEGALTRLSQIAKSLPVPVLQASRYSYNAGEASFEVQYEVTDELVEWQQKVIDSLNPLRGELTLERDPAGHEVTAMLQNTDILGENLRMTGYGEVGDPRNGGLFRPHVTLNWFELGTDISDTTNLPPIDELNGKYPKLGVYLLGPYGTCPQRIAQYECVS